MHIEYAKDICRTAGIPWRPEYEPDIAPLATKLEVNKHIFMVLAKKPSGTTELPPDFEKMLKTRGPNGSMSQKVDRIQIEINGIHQQLDRYNRDRANYITQLQNLRRELERLFGITEDETYVDELKKINASGLWVFERITGAESFVMRSANPVQVHWKDDVKGVDMKVWFGHVLATISLNGPITVSFPELQNGHKVSDFSHPHVSRSGAVCWGNAEPTYNKFAEEGKLANAMNALWLVLNNYNDGSPYVSLDRFFVTRHPETLNGNPRKLAKDGRVWVLQSVFEDLLGTTTTVEVFDERDNDDGDHEYFVDIWQNRIMPYNIVDPLSGFYLAGPRGGASVQISEDDFSEE